MPYSTEIMCEGTGILHVGEGILTGAEIIAEISGLMGKLPCPDLITHGLIDLTAVTRLQVSTAEIQNITGIDRRLAKVLRGVFVAIVAPDDLAFGVSNMYAGNMWNSHWTIETFRSREQAVAWLDSRLSAGPEPAL